MDMEKVHILDHPLLQHKLSILRDENTGVKDFREVVSEIATLMCYEATRDLPLEEVEIKTPITTAKFKTIAGKKLAIVPVLRAGLGMVDGILTLIPSAKVGHIGLYRDPDTLEPVEYYCKMPTDIAERDVIILDPMLATGGSASAAIQFIKNYEVKHIKLMNIIAAPEGVERVRRDHPDVDIYVAAVDEKLNDHGYIVPGLGDAGDRIFGNVGGHLAVVLHGLQRLRIPVESDVAHLGRGDQREDAVHHTQAGPEYGDNGQLFPGDGLESASGHGGLNLHFFQRQIAGGLVAHQRGDFRHHLTKILYAGVFVPEDGELVLQQRVVQNMYLFHSHRQITPFSKRSFRSRSACESRW